MALCYQCFREKGAETVCPFCGYDPTGSAKKHPMALRPESILNGRYILGRVLGQGGFGITYIAQDYQTKERVAVKEYFPTEFAGRTNGTHVQITPIVCHPERASASRRISNVRIPNA